jgi:hypothetical protein
MAGLKLAAFAGISPRTGPALLQDNEAQKAVNTKLYSGELRSWNTPGSLTPAAPIRADALSIYKHTKTTGEDLWLSWATDVNVVPGPIYATGEYPIYYTGDGTPRKTNAALAQSGAGPYYPGDYLELGVPAPSFTPTVSASGGSGTPESRVYLVTYISLFGSIEEESAPSPVSAIVSVNPGGTVTVGGLGTTAPAGKYNITKKRIYRSVAGTSANVYLKVADVSIGTSSYADSLSATALGAVLPSTTWTTPPSDLQGIVAMANGILAGFRGNEVYFSEPFLPHAWPAEYALTVEFPVVGITALGESLVVATKGNPFIISGASPLSMSQSKLPLYEPCVSKRSIASDENGAMYASPNGIVKVAPGFAGIATRPLMTRDEWQVYLPGTMLGTVLDGRYYLFCDAGMPQGKGALILDRNESASPLTMTSLHTTAVHVEPTTARLFIADDGNVKAWSSDGNSYLPYEWKSKLFILPRPLNFGAGQVEADFGNISLSSALAAQRAAIIAANQALFASTSDLQSTVGLTGPVGVGLVAGSALSPIPDAGDGAYITLTAFAQGKQVAVVQVRSADPFRLPSGFKGDRWEFQLNGNIPIRHVKIAETSTELVNL